jgi:hypothetical protein
MKLALLTCAIYPDREEAEKNLWIFLASARKAGFAEEDIHLYGIGRDFHRTTWHDKKLNYQLDYLKTLPTEYTHILYSDGADALICGSAAEIIWKYNNLKHPPMLISAAPYIANGQDAFWQTWQYNDFFDEEIVNRYPHVGGYLAERDFIIDAFERMLTLPRQTWDDCWNYMDAWKEGWFRPQLDYRNEIFYLPSDKPHVEYQRVVAVNPQVDRPLCTQPNVIHLTGGHVDRDTYKDGKLKPLAERLGIV